MPLSCEPIAAHHGTVSARYLICLTPNLQPDSTSHGIWVNRTCRPSYLTEDRTRKWENNSRLERTQHID